LRWCFLSIASSQASEDAVAPAGAVVFSPITDLALTGRSFDTRAEADPFFTKSQASRLIGAYLGTTDPTNPLASPLYADLSGLPPLRIHVGDDEVLLDDSLRYVERAAAAGVDAKLDIWTGMPHGFVTNVDGLNAAAQAIKATGTFLAGVLSESAPSADSKETHMSVESKTVDNSESMESVAEARSRDGLLSPSREEEIRRRAYEIYLGRGGEPGYETEDWLQAERDGGLIQDSRQKGCWDSEHQERGRSCNLHDVFDENDPTRRRAAIDEIFTEDCVFYDPKGASTRAATRSIESRARSRLLGLTFDISQ
jgi:hypothetical protein